MVDGGSNFVNNQGNRQPAQPTSLVAHPAGHVGYGTAQQIYQGSQLQSVNHNQLNQAQGTVAVADAKLITKKAQLDDNMGADTTKTPKATRSSKRTVAAAGDKLAAKAPHTKNNNQQLATVGLWSVLVIALGAGAWYALAKRRQRD